MIRAVAAAFALALAGAASAAADDDAVRRRALEDELLGWCVGRDLWPAASEEERRAAPPACHDAAAGWAATLIDVAARDGAGGGEDGTRSIAAWVEACAAMNDLRAGARMEDGRCSTRDRRMTGDAQAPRLFLPEEDGAATRAAERELALWLPDGTPAATARAALEAHGFACDPESREAVRCLFSHRELAYAARAPTLFATVFWSVELPLDRDARVAGRRLGVALVHP